MEEHVYPAEPALAREDEAADEVMLESARAREGGGAVGAAPAAGGGRHRSRGSSPTPT